MRALALYAVVVTAVAMLGVVLMTGTDITVQPWTAAVTLLLTVPVMVLGIVILVFSRQTA